MQEQNSFGKLKKFENRKDNNFLLGFPVSEKRRERNMRNGCLDWEKKLFIGVLLLGCFCVWFSDDCLQSPEIMLGNKVKKKIFGFAREMCVL